MLRTSVSYIKPRAVDVELVSAAEVTPVAFAAYQKLVAADIELESNAAKYRPVVGYVKMSVVAEYVDPRVTDHYLRIILNAGYSDDVVMTDELTFSVGKSASDDVVMTDSVANSVDAPQSDDVVMTDELTFSVDKPVSDSVVMTDSVSISEIAPQSDDFVMTDNVAMTLAVQGTGGVNGSAINELAIDEEFNEVFSA